MKRIALSILLPCLPCPAIRAAEPLPIPADERVLLPGLRAGELIAASGALHPLREAAGAGATDQRGAEADVSPHAPADALALLVREQARGVREPRRLLASAVAMVALLPYCSVPVRRSLLRSALLLLAHKYPRVRAATATAIYEHALTCEADLPEGNTEEACAILVGTAWDGDDADVKAARAAFEDAIAALVPFAAPVPVDASLAAAEGKGGVNGVEGKGGVDGVAVAANTTASVGQQVRKSSAL